MRNETEIRDAAPGKRDLGGVTSELIADFLDEKGGIDVGMGIIIRGGTRR